MEQIPLLSFKEAVREWLRSEIEREFWEQGDKTKMAVGVAVAYVEDVLAWQRSYHNLQPITVEVYSRTAS